MAMGGDRLWRTTMSHRPVAAARTGIMKSGQEFAKAADYERAIAEYTHACRLTPQTI